MENVQLIIHKICSIHAATSDGIAFAYACASVAATTTAVTYSLA